WARPGPRSRPRLRPRSRFGQRLIPPAPPIPIASRAGPGLARSRPRLRSRSRTQQQGPDVTPSLDPMATALSTEWKVPGVSLRDVTMHVPLDHDDHASPALHLFARIATGPGGEHKPYLVFLQGGPGS